MERLLKVLLRALLMIPALRAWSEDLRSLARDVANANRDKFIFDVNEDLKKDTAEFRLAAFVLDALDFIQHDECGWCEDIKDGGIMAGGTCEDHPNRKFWAIDGVALAELRPFAKRLRTVYDR